MGCPPSRPPTGPPGSRPSSSGCAVTGSSSVDEVGYIPFEQDAANLPFARWGDVFGDHAVAAAMIDRIVHHAEVITLKGASYRLKNTGINTTSLTRTSRTQITHALSR